MLSVKLFVSFTYYKYKNLMSKSLKKSKQNISIRKKLVFDADSIPILMSKNKGYNSYYKITNRTRNSTCTKAKKNQMQSSSFKYTKNFIYRYEIFKKIM